jgi:hypothetical protein
MNVLTTIALMGKKSTGQFGKSLFRCSADPKILLLWLKITISTSIIYGVMDYLCKCVR